MKRARLIWGILFVWFVCMFMLFVMTVRGEKITLQWDKVDGVDGYRIFQSIRLLKDDGSWENIYDFDNPVGEVAQDIDTLEVDLPGEDGKEIRYMFVARSFIADDTSENSNEVEYKVNRIIPPSPTSLAGNYSKDDSIINLSWDQPVEQWYDVDHWIVYYRLEDTDWTELGRVNKDNDLILSKEFDAIPSGETKTVDFNVIAFRRSGTYSADSDILTMTINRREVPPVQNLRINIEIPVI